MKKSIVTIIMVISVLGLQAQNRKYIANFPLVQQYYNPALTGYEGSVVKSFYRNQWAGFEGAPKTVFVSGELDLADRKLLGKGGAEQDITTNGQVGARQAFGLSVLHDEFGAFSENQVFLSYGSSVRLSENISLRWGTAINYSSQSLNGNKLVVDQEVDPQYLSAQGSNRMSKFDLNFGLSLTADHYYVGYAVQDVGRGGLITTGDTFLKDMYTRKHIVQAGYRTAISDEVGLVGNAIYRYDEKLKETVEGQLKVVYQNMLWIGGGYRNDLAYSLTAGLQLNKFQVGYAYESPVGDAKYMTQSTNEIMLSYSLKPRSRSSRQLTTW
ncbi:PorP/SprF family type IX secretion system membrane protein [Pontibacter harenae]|uniref:PorP/SprF family type IX secretion system membrane protein n=1 Tax=Pontibacter harenae TaxID=2894083 RepID=UPI001E36B669|nr:PorP/SprF family type IX secretion system membrane protein [Pontibacter harenae]MCC9168690.1 PorP/SprF family type IX secretion system membrane protein [Pontibacter harenae]